MLYSKSTAGFYLREIHGDGIPADAVEITDEEHRELLEGQSCGRIISADATGRPFLTDRPPPTAQELRAAFEAAPVTPLQLRRAVRRSGLQAQLWAAELDDDLRDWLEYSHEFRRGDPEVALLAQALELTELQVDELFTLARDI